MFHCYNDLFCTRYKVHCTPHTRNHFAWNHPVGEIPMFVNFKSTKYCYINMTTTD